jgi:hypothetical protein
MNMPVRKCPNGKWRIGSGECMYTSREKAVAAYQAYLAQNEIDRIISLYELITKVEKEGE